MLYGARGNSGVILSQLFQGLARELEDDSIIDAGEFVEGFITAYKYAYQALVSPKEGTILTVARIGIENIKHLASRGTDIDVFFLMYINSLKKELDNTPNLLPILKEVGVIDAGGLGYLTIITGMYKYLNDEIITTNDNINNQLITNPKQETNINNKSNLNFGYCTEFILYFNNNNLSNKKSFNKNEFITKLNNLGDSIVCIEDLDVVKVHIHTKNPGLVINLAQEYGEFYSIKIENMDLEQINIPKKQEEFDIVKIVITQGEPLKQTMKDIGANVVIDGGMTMNTSTSELIDAINSYNAKHYLIIVNNKNIILSAEQAIKQLPDKDITIIKTINLLEGYYVCAVDDPTSNNLEQRIQIMKDTTHLLKTIEIFKASRDCIINNINIKAGYYTSLTSIINSDDISDEILDSNQSFNENIINSLKKITNISDYSECIILKGLNINIDEEKLTNIICQEFKNIEVVFMDGGQPLIDAIIGLI